MDRAYQISFAGGIGGNLNSPSEFFSACGTGKRNLCLNECDLAHTGTGCNAIIWSSSKRSKCFSDAQKKRNNCKNNCPKADQDCITAKNNPDGTLDTTAPDSTSTAPTDTVDKAPSEKSTDNTKDILIYTGIIAGSAIGLSLLIGGILSAINAKPKSSIRPMSNSTR